VLVFIPQLWGTSVSVTTLPKRCVGWLPVICTFTLLPKGNRSCTTTGT